MRVLLSTIGSRGDVQPLVALALQLRALGREVRLCVPPDFHDWIDYCKPQDAGLFELTDRSVEVVLRSPMEIGVA